MSQTSHLLSDSDFSDIFNQSDEENPYDYLNFVNDNNEDQGDTPLFTVDLRDKDREILPNIPPSNDSSKIPNNPNISSKQNSTDKSRQVDQPMANNQPINAIFPQNQSNYQFFQSYFIYDTNALCSRSLNINGAHATMRHVSNDFQKFVEYLNKIFNKKVNKKKLHLLYELFQQHYGWKKLTTKEKRAKRKVLWKLYQHKDLVQYCIQNHPIIFLRPILLQDKNKSLKSRS